PPSLVVVVTKFARTVVHSQRAVVAEPQQPSARAGNAHPVQMALLVVLAVALVGAVAGWIVGVATAPSSDPGKIIDQHDWQPVAYGFFGFLIGLAVGVVGIVARWIRFNRRLRH